MIDFPWKIRFEDSANNYLFVMVLSVLLLVSFLIWSLNRATKYAKGNGIFVSLILIIPCYIVIFFAQLQYVDIKSSGIDKSFEVIDKLNVNSNNYVLYRTNGGATTSFGLALRLEKQFMTGLNVVKEIYSRNKSSEGTLKLAEENRIILQIQPYDKIDKLEVVSFNL